MADARLVIGYVAGVHGLHGGVRVRLFDPASDAVRPGVAIELRRDDAPMGRFEVERCEPVPGKRDARRVQLRGIDDREAADALRGCEIVAERESLPEDEYYLVDAIGAVVERQRPDGTRQALGRVVALSSNGPQDLFDVEWRDEHGTAHRWLLPALPQFVRELADGRVLADVPPGFLPDALEDEP